MSIEQEIAGLTQSTTDLLDAVNTKKATLDTAVSNAQTAVTDATSQVSLAAAEKVGAQAARDEAETHKDQAYTYSQSAASAVAYQDLTAIAESKVETAVDVFVYDTRKDSDGGAWRKRTQGTSWYNEPLNTSTRGSRKEFPAVAVIVAESNKVTIYDGDDPSLPMWMKFDVRTTYTGCILTFGDSGSVTSLSALNSSIVVSTGQSTSNDGVNGVFVITFLSDSAIKYCSSQLSTTFDLDIARRNALNGSGNDYTSGVSLPKLVSNKHNDVAMTVLPDAPIDPDTGLPIPTIAVATDGGVSVIKDDGTVVDSVSTSAKAKVEITPENYLVSSNDATSNVFIYHKLEDITSDGFNGTVLYGDIGYPNVPSYAMNDGLASKSSEINFSGGNSGLVKYSFDPSLLSFFGSPNSGSIAYITSTYNTGWMNGDIKLATLSDTDDTDLVGTELVTNGTFDTDSDWSTRFDGWSISGGTASHTGALQGYIEQEGIFEVGKTYVLTFTSTGQIILPGSTGLTSSNMIFNSDGTQSITGVAINTNLSFYSNGTSTIDNVSVRLAEEDRSVNGNGLQVFGTVQKNPVATGADLVAYSGFGASDYLQQPYNPDLDFGTGDFCVMGWFKAGSTTSNQTLVSKHDNISGTLFQLNTFSGVLNFYSSGWKSSGYTPTVGAWECLTVTRESGILYIYANGVLKYSVASTDNYTLSGSTLRFGINHLATWPLLSGSSLALMRISATAPTAEQIAKIYRDEKPLFQENAKATLHGTSDAVTALAYDEDTELLHVGTSAGRSVFSGLQRVDNTTDAVGVAISASNNLIVEE